MKPYCRKGEPVKGGKMLGKGGNWKKDCHCHNKNHRKIGTWWEDFSDNGVDRGSIKQKVKKEIEKEIDELNKESDIQLQEDYDEYLKERLAGIELIQFYKDKNNCGTVFDSKEENDKSI